MGSGLAFLLYLVLSTPNLFVSAEIYYVVPTSSTLCPEKGVPCFTLSQYAAKPWDYFATNTTLILLPGKHPLDSKLSIRGIKSLQLLAKSDYVYDTIVTCYDSTKLPRQTFEMIEQIQISGITYLGCTSIHTKMADQFTIKNCSFLLHWPLASCDKNCTGLMFDEVLDVNIDRCIFSASKVNNSIRAVAVSNSKTVNIVNSTFTNYRPPSFGAVVVVNSSVMILTSTFTTNAVKGFGRGGAVFIRGSNVTITNSVFTSNVARVYGGAICAYFSNITISNTTFTSNAVIGSQGRLGGAVFAVRCTITVNVSTFTNNMVASYRIGIFGGCGAFFAYGSTSVSINLCTFTNNGVRKVNGYGIGGAVCIYYSTITGIVNNSTFTNNYLLTENGRGSGGAVGFYMSTLIVNNSTFTNNTAIGRSNDTLGGALDTSYSNVTLTSCKFEDNTVKTDRGLGGAAAFLDNNIVIVIGCTFKHNAIHASIQGGGGAVFLDNGTSITIHSSTFTSNTVAGDGLGGAIYADGSDITVELNSSYTTFANNTVTGVGSGGALLAINSNITTNTNTFTNNSVRNLGGAVYAYYGNISMQNSMFLKNIAKITGGALYLSNTNMQFYGSTTFLYNIANFGVLYAEDTKLKFSGNTTICKNHGSLFAFFSNVTFQGYTDIMNNSAKRIRKTSQTNDYYEEGGAVTGIQSNIVFTGVVNLNYNTARYGGAILVTESKVYIYGRFSLAHNTASIFGGGIYAFQSELNFKGDITLARNTAIQSGGGLHSVGSSTKLSGGSAYFSGNHAKKGGGISLMLNSKLYIIKNDFRYLNHSLPKRSIHLQFISNFAEYGGALYVSDDTNTGTCKAVPFGDHLATSECFFQALSVRNIIYPSYKDELMTVNTYFTANNTATVAGGSLYGGLLDRCTVSPMAELFLKYHTLSPYLLSGTFYFLNITNLQPQDFNSSARISSDPVRVCFCKDNQPDCSYHPQPKYVKKGEGLRVSLVAVDQVNNTVPNTTIRGTLSLEAALGEGQSAQQTQDGNCTELVYEVLSPRDSEQLHLYAEGPCMDTGISIANITVNIAPCPVGFIDSHMHCECDPRLYPEYVSSCFVGNETLLRKGNVWFASVNSTEHHGYMFHRHCPFDYCHPPTEVVFVNLNIKNGADAQCAFNRSGKLCGSCEDGLSLSLGSSRCMPCSNNWLVLTAVFVIAGIALVAFLMICNLTVAVGTINGVTLYANVIAANSAVFIPFDGTNILTVFIAWINLDFGFESCFFDGLDGYVKVWLQLAFPLYILVLVVMVIWVADKSYTFAKLLYNWNPVATLATLILLSYTKFIRIIIAALSFATIQYSDGFQEKVWLYDANISYLEGKHVILFAIALLVLMIGLAYTFLMLFWQLLMRCKLAKPLEWIKLKFNINAFMDTCHAPLNTKHRYWTGLLLLVRVILYLISALNILNNPSINLVSIIFAVGGLLLINNPGGNVYKYWCVNVLESSYIVNLILFAVVSLYFRESKGNQTILAYTSTSIAFITFLATVVYHVYAFAFCRALRRLKNKFNCDIRHDQGSEAPIETDEKNDSLETCSVTVTEIDGHPTPLDTDSSLIDPDDTGTTQETDPSTLTPYTQQDSSSETPHIPNSHNTTEPQATVLVSIDKETELLTLAADVHHTDHKTHIASEPTNTTTTEECDSEMWEDETTPLLSAKL